MNTHTPVLRCSVVEVLRAIKHLCARGTFVQSRECEEKTCTMAQSADMSDDELTTFLETLSRAELDALCEHDF